MERCQPVTFRLHGQYRQLVTPCLVTCPAAGKYQLPPKRYLSDYPCKPYVGYLHSQKIRLLYNTVKIETKSFCDLVARRDQIPTAKLPRPADATLLSAQG